MVWLVYIHYLGCDRALNGASGGELYVKFACPVHVFYKVIFLVILFWL
jgi:hypothetical protein